MKANRRELKISLVIATLGARPDQLRRLLQSLADQNYTSLEIIIVDQSGIGGGLTVADAFKAHMNIVLVTCKPGLSRARNVGLDQATGEIIGFPDDDCWYPANFCHELAQYFEHNVDVDAVTGRYKDSDTGRCSAPAQSRRVSLWRHTTWGSSVSLFFRKQVVERIGRFDETLGAGSKSIYRYGEETDYLLRAIGFGYNVRCESSRICVYHAVSDISVVPDEAFMMKNASVARIFRNRKLPFGPTFKFLVAPIVKATFALVTGQRDAADRQIKVFYHRLTAYHAK